jgi:ribose 5-phosphate isomerase
VKAIGELVAEEGLKIIGISTSDPTADKATGLGVPRRRTLS